MKERCSDKLNVLIIALLLLTWAGTIFGGLIHCCDIVCCACSESIS